MNNLKINITIAALILSGICAENALSMKGEARRLDGKPVSAAEQSWARTAEIQGKARMAREKTEEARFKETPVIATIHEGPVRGSFTESGQIQRPSSTRPTSAAIRKSAAAPKTHAKTISQPARTLGGTEYRGGVKYTYPSIVVNSAASQDWARKAEIEGKAKMAIEREEERQRRLNRAARIKDSDGIVKTGFFQTDNTFRTLKP